MENKLTKGRQKIEMKLIENEHARFNTFSKRKAGIFKKAGELCTTCGVDIGIIFFSPTGKPFSFAHPSIESICNRFTDPTHFVKAHRRENKHELNQQLNGMLKQLEAAKKKEKLLDQMEKELQSKGGWKAPIDELSIHELEQLKIQMQQLQKNVSAQLDE
ncbi:Agamous-like MADS-box protein AGL61 [Camellia lanceoleosa]|uniref:Agamous-like MADS-box protein AGL61 n=1 Tax=Camellia lanceoleosa TaxID=1840588 RepID=A0ACC0ITE5_9ERIC|nr:Agamous-like MADS-box protein AGL61 [Camellia lanceoleosa]